MTTLIENYPEMPSPCEDCPFKDCCREQFEDDTDKIGCWDRCNWINYCLEREALLR